MCYRRVMVAWRRWTTVGFSLFWLTANGVAAPDTSGQLPSRQPAPPNVQLPFSEVRTGASHSAPRLISPGTGTRRRLTFGAKGGLQAVDLSMSFAQHNHAAGHPDTVFPVIRIAADIEGAVGSNGAFELTARRVGIDADDVADEHITADRERAIFRALVNAGLQISGEIAEDGTNTALALSAHIERPAPSGHIYMSGLDVLSFGLPIWPVLPVDPVGSGARWEVDSKLIIGNEFTLDASTTYEVTAQDATTSALKATTKITALDASRGQGSLVHGDISSVSGQVASLITLTDGELCPSIESSLRVEFSQTSSSELTTPTIEIKTSMHPKGAPSAGSTKKQTDQLEDQARKAEAKRKLDASRQERAAERKDGPFWHAQYICDGHVVATSWTRGFSAHDVESKLCANVPDSDADTSISFMCASSPRNPSCRF